MTRENLIEITHKSDKVCYKFITMNNVQNNIMYERNAITWKVLKIFLLVSHNDLAMFFNDRTWYNNDVSAIKIDSYKAYKTKFEVQH